MPHDTQLQQLVSDRVASRIFGRDPLVFVGPDATEDHASIRNRLGWLDAPASMPGRVREIADVVRAAGADRLTDVYLLGMGGSSLCAEVLRDVGGARDGVRLTVLDTTDERAVRHATETLTPERALFLVASKSGSTIEVTALERHFWSRMTDAGKHGPGSHFVAITDPDTSLVSHASSSGYRHTFINPADIGGRYSALSLFGLVPAALLGRDLMAFLAKAEHMADRCRADDRSNPGLVLGAFMGWHAANGRDKLTLLVGRSLAPLGVWIEQLVAESTGKHGKGVLPVVDEPPGPPDEYGHDRAFVAVLTPDDAPIADLARRLELAGHPVFRIETSAADLAAEFFRWEFATAVAGSALRVNPFDEPNVRDAKARTQAQLDARRAKGVFTLDPPLTPGERYSTREHHTGQASEVAREGRYLAVLDYLPADPQRTAAVERVRRRLRQRVKVATTYGVGPRYLHSTGQYHKGGPNAGTFLLLTATDESATPVPGAEYTFSMLKQAQALGDFDALVAAGREVIHCHIDDPATNFSAMLETVALSLT